MNKSNYFYCTLLAILSLFSSCKTNPADYTFEDLSEPEIEEMHTAQDTLNKGLLGFARGETQKMWKGLHKNCMSSQWLKRPFYFGVTNSLALGTVTDKKFEVTFNTPQDIFTEEDIKYFTDPGSPSSCEYIQKISFDLKNELSVSFADQNQELSAVFKKAVDREVSLDGWQVQNLLTDRFIEKMKASENPAMQTYINRVFDNKNRLLNKIIKVNGFSSTITAEKAFSSELKLKLEEGLVGKIGNTGVNVRVEYLDSVSLKLVNDGDFYVYGKFVKPKKIK